MIPICPLCKKETKQYHEYEDCKRFYCNCLEQKNSLEDEWNCYTAEIKWNCYIAEIKNDEHIKDIINIEGNEFYIKYTLGYTNFYPFGITREIRIPKLININKKEMLNFIKIFTIFL